MRAVVILTVPRYSNSKLETDRKFRRSQSLNWLFQLEQERVDGAASDEIHHKSSKSDSVTDPSDLYPDNNNNSHTNGRAKLKGLYIGCRVTVFDI
jgi:hypothetical protein